MPSITSDFDNLRDRVMILESNQAHPALPEAFTLHNGALYWIGEEDGALYRCPLRNDGILDTTGAELVTHPYAPQDDIAANRLAKWFAGEMK